MRVGDVQVSARRLMVPGSYKGRGGNSGSDPVPVGDDVIEVLLPAIAERPSDAPLFERWFHEQQPGGIAWKTAFDPADIMNAGAIVCPLGEKSAVEP
jgi:hypothetical protein